MAENNNVLDASTEPEAPISQSIAGVRFRTCGKMYTFDADDVEVSPGARVVVDSEMGLSLGRVVTPKQIIERTKEPLKKILRIATDEDFETARNNKSLEDEARAFCVEKVKESGLPMKIIATETTLDQKRLIFYFTADGRIDFRELVRELASRFKTRIEMRQIGVRDEVKLLGGFGCCGRQTCCSLFLTSFEPITIKMAKEQDLSINQSKLSGVCGRLMCCLGYEHRTAREEARRRQEELQQAAKEEALPGEAAGTGAGELPGKAAPARDTSPRPREDRRTAPGEKTEKDGEKQGEKKRNVRRHFKRRKRHKGPRDPQQQPQTPAAAPKPEDKTASQDQKAKGKAVKRRRKFWKKKKAAPDGPQAKQ